MRRSVTEREPPAIDADPVVVAKLSNFAYDHGLAGRFLLMLGCCASVTQIKRALDREILARTPPGNSRQH